MGTCPGKEYQTARGTCIGKSSQKGRASKNRTIKEAGVIDNTLPSLAGVDNADGQRLIGPDRKENNNRHHLLSASHSSYPVLKNCLLSKKVRELRACYIQNEPNGLMITFRFIPKKRNKD